MSNRRLSDIISDYQMGHHISTREIEFFMEQTEGVLGVLFSCGPLYALTAKDLLLKRGDFERILLAREQMRAQR